MSESFESQKPPVAMPHQHIGTGSSTYKNQITCVSWDVSSLQTNL